MSDGGDEPKRLERRFSRSTTDEYNCPCGYLPYTHGPELHLQGRTNEELIRDYEESRKTLEILKQRPMHRKPVILELKCRACGKSERSEYHRFSFDETGHHVVHWEPELDRSWCCPDHPNSEPITTFHDYRKE